MSESDLRYCNLFLSKYHSDAWTGNLYTDIPKLEAKEQKIKSELAFETEYDKGDAEKAAYMQTNLDALTTCISALKKHSSDEFARFQTSNPQLTYDEAVVQWLAKQQTPVNLESRMKEYTTQYSQKYAASEPYVKKFINFIKNFVGSTQAETVQKSFHEKSLEEQREISNRIRAFLQNPTVRSLGIVLGLLSVPYLYNAFKFKQIPFEISIINFTRDRENVDLVIDALRKDLKAAKTSEKVILWKNKRFRVYYVTAKISGLSIFTINFKIERILDKILPNVPYDVTVERSLTRGIKATIEIGEGPVERLMLPAPPQPSKKAQPPQSRKSAPKVRPCDNGDNFPDLMHAFGDIEDDNGNIIPNKTTPAYCKRTMCGLGIRTSKDYKKKIMELRKKYPDQQSFEQNEMARLLNSCKNEDAFCTRQPEKKSTPIIHISYSGSTQCYTRRQLLEMIQSPALWYAPDNIPVYLLAPFNVYLRVDEAFRNNLIKNKVSYELVDRKKEILNDKSKSLQKNGIIYNMRSIEI